MCKYANITLLLAAKALGTLCSSLWPTTGFSQICGSQFCGASHLLTMRTSSARLWASPISALRPSQKPQEPSQPSPKHRLKVKSINPQPMGDVSQGINAPSSLSSDGQFWEAFFFYTGF